MNYERFKIELLRSFSECFPGWEVKVNKIYKNNTTSYEAITIHSDKQKLSPCIRLEDYYEDYINPTKRITIFDIVKSISEVYKTLVVKEEYQAAFDMIEDFEVMKDRIVCKLINRPMNQELLKKVLFTPFNGEFAVIYSIVLRQEGEKIESVRITHSLLDQWQISLEDLHSTAIGNTMRLFPSDSFRIEEMISHLFDEPMVTQEKCGNMYVMSNKQGINGATVLIYPNVMKEFVSRYQIEEKYLYIILSSIHELILVPAMNLSMNDMLEKMVREVNENEVAQDEILSNHIFLYNVPSDSSCMEMNGENYNER